MAYSLMRWCPEKPQELLILDWVCIKRLPRAKKTAKKESDLKFDEFSIFKYWNDLRLVRSQTILDVFVEIQVF